MLGEIPLGESTVGTSTTQSPGNGRLSQNALEALVAGPNVRVSADTLEVLTTVPAARVSHAIVEVLISRAARRPLISMF
jgi:hypothetical protein